MNYPKSFTKKQFVALASLYLKKAIRCQDENKETGWHCDTVYAALVQGAHKSFQDELQQIRTGWNTHKEYAEKCWPIFNSMWHQNPQVGINEEGFLKDVLA